MGARNRDRRWYPDLVAVLTLGVLAGVSVLPGVLAVEGGILSAARAVLVWPFLLIGPGYALVAALFPGDGELSPLERSVFSVGASLALIALVGLGLDQLPPGVTAWTVGASQLVLVGALVVVATVRRRRAGVASLGYRDLAERAWRGRDMIGGGNRGLQAALVVAVLLTVGAATYTAAQPLPSERYTELSITGPDGTLDGVPTRASSGEAVNFTVGIYSHEYRTSEVGIQAQVRRPDGSRAVVWTESMTVAHDERVALPASVQVPATEGGDRVKVEVLLFQGTTADSPVTPEEAYRSVYTWVTVEDRANSSTSAVAEPDGGVNGG